MKNENNKSYRSNEGDSNNFNNVEKKTDPMQEELNELDPQDIEITDINPQEGELQEDASEECGNEVMKLSEELDKQKREYMFLMAEFDNFRKRTLREKSELIKNAGEQVLKGLLPIVDDFERGLRAADNSEDSMGLKEGMQLIYNKLIKYLASNGVKEMDLAETEFDADRHEAISAVPAPSEELKGKILDTVEKGYMLNDKVLRHAKVVVGQ